MTALRTMWCKAMVLRIRARRVRVGHLVRDPVARAERFPVRSGLIRIGGSPSLVTLCGASRRRHLSPYQYCSNHRRVPLDNNSSVVDGIRGVRFNAMAASPGARICPAHISRLYSALATAAFPDRYHTWFGSLEERPAANVHGLEASRRHIRNYGGRFRDNIGRLAMGLMHAKHRCAASPERRCAVSGKRTDHRRLRPRADSR